MKEQGVNLFTQRAILRGALVMRLGLMLLMGLVPSVLAQSDSWPPPDEIHQRLSPDLPDLPPPPPGLTNPVSYLQSLSPKVLLSAPASPLGSTLSKAVLYRDNLGYLRIESLTSETPSAVREALSALGGSNNLSGVVLDLRFSRGWDFESAAAVAGLFSRRSGESLRSGAQRWPIPNNASALPVMVLVNGETQGAAEVLAGTLRRLAHPCLVLGTNTAGMAYSYRAVEFTPEHRVWVASTPILLPGGNAIPDSGWQPDLIIDVPLESERLYREDEYQRVVNGDRLKTNNTLRLNEAELVRRRRGLRLAVEQPSAPSERAVADPGLARALDLLEGWTQLGPNKSRGESR